MAVNSSSSFNVSSATHPPQDFQNSFDYIYNCIKSRSGVYTIYTVIVTNMAVILPLCTITLYLGYKQWRQQGLSRLMSNSELFTFHVVLLELIHIFGFIVTFIGILSNLKAVVMVGIRFYPISFSGQMMFHTLTCVERYLAVVHPVTYLGLKNANGIRIRNITIACVLLLSFGIASLLNFYSDILISIFSYFILSYCFVPISLAIMFFCSVSILRTLIHSKPGAAGGVRKHTDRTKLRAFCTIMIILGVLVFRLGGNILLNVLLASVQMGYFQQCGMLMSDYFFSLPCSLILPLQFLHKTGKLKCCKSKTASGLTSD